MSTLDELTPFYCTFCGGNLTKCAGRIPPYNEYTPCPRVLCNVCKVYFTSIRYSRGNLVEVPGGEIHCSTTCKSVKDQLNNKPQ